MDHSSSREQDIGFDLESGTDLIYINNDLGSDEKPAKINEGSSEDNVKLLMDINVEGERETGGNVIVKKVGKEKRKKGLSAKKPPRPPRGFSLDGYDHKLIKELAELAMLKRARIERMKALKQKKASKVLSSSSSSSSSHSTLFAMLFTIIFFLVILLQGRNSGISFQMAQTKENGSVFTQDHIPYVQ